MNRFALGWCVAASLLLACSGANAAQRTCDYRTVMNQLYAHGLMEDGVEMALHADVYQPTSCVDGPVGLTPPIIIFPGGGYGDQVAARWVPPIVDMADGLARAGFVAFVADYRPRTWQGHASVSETKTDEELLEFREMAATGPYPVETMFESLIATEDAFKLRGWIASQASEYQLDMAELGVMGPSSGASTGLTTAYMGDNLALGDAGLKAVVDLWGDFYPHDSLMPGESPILIVAGTKDTIIEYKYTTDIMHRAFLAQVEASRITMPGVGHGLPAADIFHRKVVGTGGMTIFEVIVQFFEAKLKPEGGQLWPPAGLGDEMKAVSNKPLTN